MILTRPKVTAVLLDVTAFCIVTAELLLLVCCTSCCPAYLHVLLPAVLLVCCTCCPAYLHVLLPAVLLVCCTSCCPAYLPVLLLAVLLACGISCRPTFLSFYLLIFLLHACLLYFLSCLAAFLFVTTFSAVLGVHVLHYVHTLSLKCTVRQCNTMSKTIQLKSPPCPIIVVPRGLFMTALQ